MSIINEQQRVEVEWYRRHGKHQERIKLDGDGMPYVMNDNAWNKDDRPCEFVEKLMPIVPIIRPYPKSKP